MARWWIGLLLLLNAALLAWNMGALQPWGWGSNASQEGPSVTLAIEPQTWASASAPAASAAPASTPKPTASAPRPKAAASAPESN